MWGLLRIILLIANAVIFAWFGYFVVMEAIHPTPRKANCAGALDKISDAAKALMGER
jgi:hypothetical protein